MIFTEYFSPINKSKLLPKVVLKDTFNYPEKLLTATKLEKATKMNWIENQIGDMYFQICPSLHKELLFKSCLNQH